MKFLKAKHEIGPWFQAFCRLTSRKLLRSKDFDSHCRLYMFEIFITALFKENFFKRGICLPFGWWDCAFLPQKNTQTNKCKHSALGLLFYYLKRGSLHVSTCATHSTMAVWNESYHFYHCAQQNMRRKPSRAVLTPEWFHFSPRCALPQSAQRKLQPPQGNGASPPEKQTKQIRSPPTPEPLVAPALLCPLA